MNDVELIAKYYRWWTLKAWCWGVKIGPVTIHGYRWYDGRVRVGITAFASDERIVWGGPLI